MNGLITKGELEALQDYLERSNKEAKAQAYTQDQRSLRPSELFPRQQPIVARSSFAGLHEPHLVKDLPVPGEHYLEQNRHLIYTMDIPGASAKDVKCTWDGVELTVKISCRHPRHGAIESTQRIKSPAGVPLQAPVVRFENSVLIITFICRSVGQPVEVPVQTTPDEEGRLPQSGCLAV